MVLKTLGGGKRESGKGKRQIERHFCSFSNYYWLMKMRSGWFQATLPKLIFKYKLNGK